jgi:hypothetical protein
MTSSEAPHSGPVKQGSSKKLNQTTFRIPQILKSMPVKFPPQRPNQTQWDKIPNIIGMLTKLILPPKKEIYYHARKHPINPKRAKNEIPQPNRHRTV